MSQVAIWWIRRDLRLRDNPALAAAAGSGQVIPVYIADQDDAGAASRWWLHHSLSALDESMRGLGSRLIIRAGQSKEVLFALLGETGATAVYWNRLYEPHLVSRDAAIKSALREGGFVAESFKSGLLFEPGEVREYRVFTPFWKACRQLQPPGEPQPALSRLESPTKWPGSLELSELGLEPKIDWAAGFREVWHPGEAGAREILSRFNDAEYATGRDRPDQIGTSRLSPHLHFGEISPREAWHRFPAEPWRRQLIWREFAHHLLFHNPFTAERPLRIEFERFPWKSDQKLYRAWTRGMTGYPLVDAGMRELWHTGWMHNRARMVAASFLVKHLLISWQEGAAWFADTLVDADLANNTLGWQWVAGCGADAAPYFRIFNPALQAAKFDPDGAYIRKWIPELGTPRYPEPIVDHAQARLRALEAFASMRRG